MLAKAAKRTRALLLPLLLLSLSEFLSTSTTVTWLLLPRLRAIKTAPASAVLTKVQVSPAGLLMSAHSAEVISEVTDEEYDEDDDDLAEVVEGDEGDARALCEGDFADHRPSGMLVTPVITQRES